MKTPPQSPSPPHQYPQEIQLKLYQAFIFSIPILFSIILFLLFYLFYLKRRANSSSSAAAPPLLPTAAADATAPLDLKIEVKNMLSQILCDDSMKSRDSFYRRLEMDDGGLRVGAIFHFFGCQHRCCVCLGEFELKEELLQVPSPRCALLCRCLKAAPPPYNYNI
ncbi:RING-type E3 ubiquitin transferase [Salvia divinorum]|uniref:RING-type E3 ubiquitin transferase n=1 Tax=Salvia divinorum TaxID=28513 RepID=A0ABD1GVS9_SALDI